VKLRPSIFQYTPSFLMAFFVFIGAYFGLRFQVLLVGFFFVLLVVWVWASIHRLFHVYEIEGDRIVCRVGILDRVSTSIEFDKIQNVRTEQNIFQTVFNIGNVLIDTSGGDGYEAVLLGVDNPLEVAQRIHEKKNVCYGGGA